MAYQQMNRSFSLLSLKHCLSETSHDPPQHNIVNLPSQAKQLTEVHQRFIQSQQQHSRSSHFETGLEFTKTQKSVRCVLQYQFQRRFALIKNINHQIYQIVDRNEAYTCNYSHFLMLLGLTLQEIQLTIAPAPRIETIIHYLMTKLQKPHLRQQLKESHYFDFMSLMIKKDKKQLEKLQQFMVKVLKEQRQVSASIFPYYFNLFALVANKEVIFAKKDSDLIEYTIDYRHQKKYDSFSIQDVKKEWLQVQKRSIGRYHTQDL